MLQAALANSVVTSHMWLGGVEMWPEQPRKKLSCYMQLVTAISISLVGLNPPPSIASFLRVQVCYPHLIADEETKTQTGRSRPTEITKPLARAGI